MKKLLFLLIAIITFTSCSREKNQLVRLALKQMPASIDSLLSDTYGPVKDLKLSSVEKIYDDDSICLIQCQAEAQTLKGRALKKQYRYIYLFDVNLSNINRRMIFGDGLIEMPMMPKERIYEVLKEKYIDHETVYNSLYVRTRPIQHPVDNKYEK